jgi:hypothetical protein
MKASLDKIIRALKHFGRKGVTFDTFAKGSPWYSVDYRKRLSEARRLPGCVIVDVWETLETGCRRKRWFMTRQPN